jgi:hypothetical protein
VTLVETPCLSKVLTPCCLSGLAFVHIFGCPPPPTPPSPFHNPGQVYCSWSHITSEQVQGRLRLPLFCPDDGPVETPGPGAVNEPIPGALLTTAMEVKEMAVAELQLFSAGRNRVQLDPQVRLEHAEPLLRCVPCLLHASTWRKWELSLA